MKVYALILLLFLSVSSYAGEIRDETSANFIRVEEVDGLLRFYDCQLGDCKPLTNARISPNAFREIVDNGKVPLWGLNSTMTRLSHLRKGAMGCLGVASCSLIAYASLQTSFWGALAGITGLLATANLVDAELKAQSSLKKNESHYLIKWLPPAIAVHFVTTFGGRFPVADIHQFKADLRELLVALAIDAQCSDVLEK